MGDEQAPKPPREGAYVWCKKCSRYHGRLLPCALYLRDRRTRDGKVVKRWAH